MADYPVHPEPDELRDLAVRYFEDALDPAEIERLGDLLASDPAHAEAFYRLTTQCEAMRTTLRRESASSPTQPDAAGRTIAPLALALAAAVLVAAAIVGVYLFASSSETGEVAPQNRSQRIATLIEATGTVMVDDGIANPGYDYRAGVYSIDSGEAELQLRSGATVRLRGATRLVVHDAMSATLTRGAADVVCPPSAHGYTLRFTDGAEVVDIGTAFTATAEPDADATVRVTDGAVELYDSDGDVRELFAGWSARIDPNSGAVAVALDDLPRHVVTHRFGVGSPRLNLRGARVTHVPAQLERLAAIVPPRSGDRSAPAEGYDLTVGRPARLYLLVMDRGEHQLDGWQRTDLSVTWTVDEHTFTDTVYTRRVEPGVVRLPGHRWKNESGEYGVPHLCLIAPHDELPDPVAPATRNKSKETQP